jgi:invasion protein IalB
MFSRISLCCATVTVATVLAIAPALAQQDQAPQGDQATQGEQAPQRNNFGPRSPQAKPGQPGPRAPQGPAPEVVATHGDWKIQCEAAPAQAQNTANNGANNTAATAAKTSAKNTANAPDAQAPDPNAKQCAMVQTARSEKNAKLGLTTVFVRAKQNGKEVTMVRILAPIGVYLPTGVALEVDGGAVGRIPFMRCLPQLCVAFGEAGGPTLDKFRKGTAANFIIYEAPGIGMPIKISLNGFAAAYQALGKL